MEGAIEVDWRDFFPYLRWIPNKSVENKIRNMDFRRRMTMKSLIQEPKRRIAAGEVVLPSFSWIEMRLSIYFLLTWLESLTGDELLCRFLVIWSENTYRGSNIHVALGDDHWNFRHNSSCNRVGYVWTFKRSKTTGNFRMKLPFFGVFFFFLVFPILKIIKTNIHSLKNSWHRRTIYISKYRVFVDLQRLLKKTCHSFHIWLLFFMKLFGSIVRSQSSHYGMRMKTPS